MDDHNVSPGSSSDLEYHGILIKNDQFLVSVLDDLIRLRPMSGESPVREFSRSSLFDVVSETDSDGLPSLALAINTPAGIRRMVLSFPEGSGGSTARDRLITQIHGIINGVHSPSKTNSAETLKVIRGVLIKGSRFRVGLGSSTITLTPDSGDGPVRTFSGSVISDAVPAEIDDVSDPSLILAINTKGGIQRMILSFPGEAGGSSACDRTLNMISKMIDGNKVISQKSGFMPSCSVSGITIRGMSFRAELTADRIALTPESGDGGVREFKVSEIFDVVPEFTTEGIQSAVLAIQTTTGIRRMVLCFPFGGGSSVERDRFVGMVLGIIDGTFHLPPGNSRRSRRDQSRTEYPICQRSGLSSDEAEVGLLLTSKRLIIYEGGGTEVMVREEFRYSQIIDASPTISLSGKPAMTVSIISPEKEISNHIFVFDEENERDSWISLLTADELPPPMIEEADDEVITSREDESEDESEIVDDIPKDPIEKDPPDPLEKDQSPPANRCPECGTILSPESPWCDLCGVHLMSERDWRASGMSDLIQFDDTFIMKPKREYGRSLTFLIAPSEAGRFEDDPIHIPITIFLTSILVCILGNLGMVSFFLRRTNVDSSLYPVLTVLTTDPVVFVTFTITLLSAAVISVLIASVLAYLIIGRVEGSFGKILKITLYSALPFGIAGLIPFIGVLVAGCWSVLILSGALRGRFDFSVSASLFPPVISYGAVSFAVILIMGGVF